jgi:hypothetical protein
MWEMVKSVRDLNSKCQMIPLMNGVDLQAVHQMQP